MITSDFKNDETDRVKDLYQVSSNKPKITETAMRSLIANPSKEHLFADTRHGSTFSENYAIFIAHLSAFLSNLYCL